MPTIHPNVKTASSNISNDELLNLIYEVIQISKSNPMLLSESSVDYWQVTGISTFRAFSNSFSSVKIFVKDEKCRIIGLKLSGKSGGYAIDKTKEIHCSVTELSHNIEMVKSFLSVEKPKKILFCS